MPNNPVAQRQPYVSRFLFVHVVAVQTECCSFGEFVAQTICLSVFFYFRYKAVYNYKPQNSDELELREGDIVQVMEKCDDGWFVGKE